MIHRESILEAFSVMFPEDESKESIEQKMNIVLNDLGTNMQQLSDSIDKGVEMGTSVEQQVQAMKQVFSLRKPK